MTGQAMSAGPYLVDAAAKVCPEAERLRKHGAERGRVPHRHCQRRHSPEARAWQILLATLALPPPCPDAASPVCLPIVPVYGPSFRLDVVS